MIKEAMGFGVTVVEAKEDAIAKLGASEFDDVQIEVIAREKKKVLGLFGGSDAQVRAYIEVADKKEKTNKKAASKPAKEKIENKEKKIKTEVKASKVEPETAKEEVKKTVSRELPEYGEPVDRSEISADSPAGKAVAYIETVLKAACCENTDIKVASRDGGSLVLLNGEDLSIIIGRRGETLDALQYLASLAANNGGGHYRISINIGDYRERREETLKVLAKRISNQVLKTGKSRSLEPMNPYERRIIHTAVQNIEGVVSNSFGDGVERRVVISPEGVEVRPPRLNDRRRRNGYNRNKSSKASAVKTPVENREPKKDSDVPLYGKIG